MDFANIVTAEKFYSQKILVSIYCEGVSAFIFINHINFGMISLEITEFDYKREQMLVGAQS